MKYFGPAEDFRAKVEGPEDERAGTEGPLTEPPSFRGTGR